jgi:hypothetical protein
MHFPHWIHNSWSQTGISRAILRLSHCEVAVGNVPSTGRALAGRSSPSGDDLGGYLPDKLGRRDGDRRTNIEL